MKILALATVCCSALLAGCNSGIPDEVRSALGPREAPRSQVYAADQRATYDAAVQAAKSMGFHITHGGPAEGELRALGDVMAGDEPGSSRQIGLRVRLEPAPGSGTELTLSLTEINQVNSNAPGSLATETPLQDTPMYADFFRNVQTTLNASVKP